MNKHFKKWIDSPLLLYRLFGEAATGKIVAHLLLGEPYLGREVYESKEHGRTIDLMSFYNFIKNKCSKGNINTLLTLPFVQEHISEIKMVKAHGDMWSPHHKTSALGRFKHIFLERLAALPSNSQFCERGVKESSQVSLGKRSEGTRSIVALARGSTIEEASNKHREMNKNTCDEKKKQMQNKEKANQIMEETRKQHRFLQNLHDKNPVEYMNRRKEIRRSLKEKCVQFKAARLEKKVDIFKDGYNKPHRPNQAETREGFYVTPLLQGKVQYGKMKKEENIKSVRDELSARNIQFSNKDNWTKLLTLLKEDEGDGKFFKPVIEYNRFITNDAQRPEEEVIRIQFSKLKRNENYEPIIQELRARNINFGNETQWRNLLTLLKDDEGDQKFFKPSTPIANFKISK